MYDYSHCGDCDSKTSIIDQEIKQATPANFGKATE
jgi:hypothetical protein